MKKPVSYRLKVPGGLIQREAVLAERLRFWQLSVMDKAVRNCRIHQFCLHFAFKKAKITKDLDLF